MFSWCFSCGQRWLCSSYAEAQVDLVYVQCKTDDSWKFSGFIVMYLIFYGNANLKDCLWCTSYICLLLRGQAFTQSNALKLCRIMKGWIGGPLNPEFHPTVHMTFIKRHFNVHAASWRCININATLYKPHVKWRSIDVNATLYKRHMHWRCIDVNVTF